ncbi:Myb-like_DNA-binding domain-containing protein [Hexamita inflata]|uniref:Myb-like DNA-binding domain-containing protein n=1 Tax=Hexamita inflata TaxID=28002 RepID=A0AA86THA4_9EUKA|nr:Myb-like DNA-binding domain-containing protein [Hexamita inflata]
MQLPKIVKSALIVNTNQTRLNTVYNNCQSHLTDNYKVFSEEVSTQQILNSLTQIFSNFQQEQSKTQSPLTSSVQDSEITIIPINPQPSQIPTHMQQSKSFQEYETYFQSLQSPEYQFSRDPNIQKAYKCWSRIEDEELKKLVQSKKKQTWDEIAVNLQHLVPRQPPRTGLMCNQRWNRVVNPKYSKGKWEIDEDFRLLEVLKTTPVGKWQLIAGKMPGRSDVQVRHRAIWHCEWFALNGAPKEYLDMKEKKIQ